MDGGNCIRSTFDGGYIVAGSSRSTDGDVTGNHGMHDYWVIKLSATGAIMWQKSFGGTGLDLAHDIRQTPDSGYILVGGSSSNDGDVSGNHGGEDYWVVRLTSTGSIIWQASLGGSGDDIASAIQQTPDGGYIVTGKSESNDGDVTGNHGNFDYWVVKLTSTGGIMWQKSLGGSADEENIEDGGTGQLVQTPDGGYIVSGFSKSNDGDVTGNHGDNDYWVVKISSTGSILWQRSYGGTGDDAALALYQTADSGVVVTGTTYSNDGDVSGNHGGYDYWLVKLSGTGLLQWQLCLGGTGASPGDVAFSIIPTLGGGYALCGLSNSNDGDVWGNNGSFDFWVVKLNCVMPSAGTITGPANVCIGSAIILSDAISGGTWSAANTTSSVLAGVVTGITAGINTISYNVANTCGSSAATKTVTTHALPIPVISVTGTTLSTTTPYITYQWLASGVPITGATSASYTPSRTYEVTVTDANGCTGTSSPVSISTLGEKPINYNGSIKVIPNPTSGIISVTGNMIESPNISVYNTLGQIVTDAVNTREISLTNFPAGMYFIRITNQSGDVIHHERILKK